jgi:hypothetical protein
VKRAGNILLVLVLLALLGWVWFSKHGAHESYASHESHGAQQTNLPAPTSKPPALLGEIILRGYATTNTTPEQDLMLMAHLMDNFTLLVKSSAQLPMSVNEDWAAAFRGKNPEHETFLPDTHIAFNAQGQLVDRWQTPLFFHALGGHRFEIRSAGPDKKMWTDDDLHRNADGTFRRGADLNPPSLLDKSTRLTAP